MGERGDPRAFHSNRARESAVARERLRQHLDRDLPVELSVPRPVTSPIPPAPSGDRIS